MKVRICFLVMSLSALIWYGVVQLAPSGRAATVSAQFHQLGKNAVASLKDAQEAESDFDFQSRIALADQAMNRARTAAISAADQKEFAKLMRYSLAVKQDHQMSLALADPSEPPDHTVVNDARTAAEATFK